MPNFKSGLLKLGEKAKKIVQLIVSDIFLVAFYLIGIGVTSLVARLVGKSFLQKKCSKTSWKRVDKNGDLLKQY